MKVKATMRRKATSETVGTREFKSIKEARTWAIETVAKLNSYPETVEANMQVEIEINPENKFSPEVY